MNSRLTWVTSGAAALVIALVWALAGDRLLGNAGEPQKQKPQQTQQAKKKARRAPAFTTAPPGSSLSFDVRPGDYEKTTKYVLEVRDANGKVTMHDLNKPPLRKRSIVVKLPELKPGQYRLFVIAEGSDARRRSKGLRIEVAPPPS